MQVRIYTYIYTRAVNGFLTTAVCNYSYEYALVKQLHEREPPYTDLPWPLHEKNNVQLIMSERTLAIIVDILSGTVAE